MTTTKTFKVYGRTGHRQKESFNASYMYDFSADQATRIIEVFNSDMTGTNEYTVVRITRNTENECFDEIEGQLSDGIFENVGTGAVVDVTDTYKIIKGSKATYVIDYINDIGDFRFSVFGHESIVEGSTAMGGNFDYQSMIDRIENDKFNLFPKKV